MKNITKVTSIILTAALAAAIIPAAVKTNKVQAATVTAVRNQIDDRTRQDIQEYYDAASAFLSLHYDELAPDVRIALETVRNAAYPVLGSDNEDDVVQAMSNLRIQLCVAQAYLNGTVADTNSAPAPVIGTAACNRVNTYGAPAEIANTVATVYSTSRNLPPQMLRTAVLNNFVERLYTTIYGRAADAAGRDAFVAKLQSGEFTATDVANAMINSSEFTSKYTTNEQYVAILYRALLGREPDTQGLTNWVNALNNGTSRQDVFNAFASVNTWGSICTIYGLAK